MFAYSTSLMLGSSALEAISMYGLAKMPPGAAAALYRLASAMDWQLLRTVAESPAAPVAA